MKINPIIAANAIQRYAHIIDRKVSDPGMKPHADRVEISDRARLYADLLNAAREPEAVNDSRIHAVVNRLASGSYLVDADRLAGRMMSGGDR